MLAAMALAILGPDAAEPSPEGPDGVTRIILEAEDLKGVDWKRFGAGSPEWRVGRHGYDFYQNNTFGGHWQSRMRTAMTDAGDNEAEITAELEMPREGKYKIWVKYECPPFFNYAFEVRLTGRRGKTLFQKVYGLTESHKHFSFNEKSLTYGDQYWAWGMDHDAAEGYVTWLPAGKMRLTLAKTKNPPPAGARSIDAILITDDLSELSSPRYARYPLLDELRRANRVFLRFRLAKDAPGPVRFTWNRWGKRYPDFYVVNGEHMTLVRSYDSSGRLRVDAKGQPLKHRDGQLEEALQPGESSVWLGVGPALNVENAATFHATAEQVDTKGQPLPAKEQPAAIPFAIDFALEPDAKRIVKSFELTREEGIRTLVVLLQPDLKTEEGREWSMKLVDIYRQVVRELDASPRTAPFPKKMRFYGGTGFPIFRWQGEIDSRNWEAGMELRRALGLNTVPGNTGSGAEIRKQREWLAARGISLTHSLSYHHSQDPESVAKQLQAQDSAADFYYLSYGDEIGLPAVDVAKPEVLQAFREYLRQQKVTPQDLGIADWDAVKPLPSFSAEVAVQIGVVPAGSKGVSLDRTLKRLYWHSSQFRIQQGIAEFVGRTRRLRELLGPQVQSSANLGGMHPFYWVHQSSFIEAFKHEAMTLAFSEDYDYPMPETSRLVAEYLAGYLKSGTKYHGQRIQFYCMPHFPGNSPEHLLQNAVLFWGQNVKDLDWFVAAPDGYSTENYVSPRGGLPIFHMMRRINEMAGLVEDWLEPAQPIPASVALLLSEASDTWELGGLSQWEVKPGSAATNAFNEERKNTYYVLRNAGYAVDLLTEADVRDGLLKPYRALYMQGENLERATARAVAEWVQAGGLLYASAGAARKDEYDEPLADLDAVLGRGSRTAFERYKGPLRAKLELLFLEPLETVRLDSGPSFSALATLERFKAAAGASVLATYADGSPAFVRAQTGKGAGYYAGSFPAEAWARKALPVVPCGKGGPESNSSQFEPTAFDPVPASLILRPLIEAGVAPEIASSQPNIVCNRLASDRAIVVTAVNLAGTTRGPARDVALRIPRVPSAVKVWSTASPQGIEHHLESGSLILRLPALDLAEVIIVETR